MNIHFTSRVSLEGELADRKLQHQLVPSLLQGDIYRRTRHVVLILQRNLVRALGVRVLHTGGMISLPLIQARLHL